MHIKTFNSGIINFLHQKQLSINTIAKWVKCNNIPYTPNQKWYCFDDIIEEKWSNFHSWVDKALNDGLIKGNKIALFDKVDYQKRKNNAKIRQKNIINKRKEILSNFPDSIIDASKKILEAIDSVNKKLGGLYIDFDGELWQKYKRKNNIIDSPPISNNVKLNDLGKHVYIILRCKHIIEYLLNNDRLENFIQYIKSHENKI